MEQAFQSKKALPNKTVIHPTWALHSGDPKRSNVEQFYQVAQAEYFNQMEIAHKIMRI